MEKIKSLKKNKEFQQVFKNGKSAANRQFVVYVLQKKEQPYLKIGLSVSKKIGNAVVRNRVKRLIREVVRDKQAILRTGCDIVVIARKPTCDMDFHQTHKSLMHVFKRAGLLMKTRGGSRAESDSTRTD